MQSISLLAGNFIFVISISSLTAANTDMTRDPTEDNWFAITSKTSVIYQDTVHISIPDTDPKSPAFLQFISPVIIIYTKLCSSNLMNLNITIPTTYSVTRIDIIHNMQSMCAVHLWNHISAKLSMAKVHQAQSWSAAWLCFNMTYVILCHCSNNSLYTHKSFTYW